MWCMKCLNELTMPIENTGINEGLSSFGSVCNLGKFVTSDRSRPAAKCSADNIWATRSHAKHLQIESVFVSLAG